MIPDFNLPSRTFVNKVVPKNAFEQKATQKQKKLLSALVEKIIWLNKLSPDTINLASDGIDEIQVFQLILRKKELIPELLELVDRSIPYPILFIVSFDEQYYLNLSIKHPNPADANNSVVDWPFTTNWLGINQNIFGFALRRSLDFVLLDLCTQLSSTNRKFDSIETLVTFEKRRFGLDSQIAKLSTAIEQSSLFKEKVAMNIDLQHLKKELTQLMQENAL